MFRFVDPITGEVLIGNLAAVLSVPGVIMQLKCHRHGWQDAEKDGTCPICNEMHERQERRCEEE
jgi:hypothetical protein